MAGKTKIRMLSSVAGAVGSVDSPAVGTVIEVPDDVATVWADGERAELVKDAPEGSADASALEARIAELEAENAALRAAREDEDQDEAPPETTTQPGAPETTTAPAPKPPPRPSSRRVRDNPQA